MIIENQLGGVGEGAELGKLGGEGRKRGVILDRISVFAFVECVLNFGMKVTEELLSEGARPRGYGGSGAGVERRNERTKFLEDLSRGVEGFLFAGGVETGGGKLAEFVENSLGG